MRSTLEDALARLAPGDLEWAQVMGSCSAVLCFATPPAKCTDNTVNLS